MMARKLTSVTWTPPHSYRGDPSGIFTSVRLNAAEELVDHCVPASVAGFLDGKRHEAWTAYQARLTDTDDQSLIIYAEDKEAVLVTTNRDCALKAQRMQSASAVWLSVREVDAETAMSVALGWLAKNRLPAGRVLRIRKTAEPVLLSPPRRRKRRS